MCKVDYEKQITVGIKFLEINKLFHDAIEQPSLESVALTASGHRPNYIYKFSMEKVKSFFKDHGITVTESDNSPMFLNFSKQ